MIGRDDEYRRLGGQRGFQKVPTGKVVMTVWAEAQAKGNGKLPNAAQVANILRDMGFDIDAKLVKHIKYTESEANSQLLMDAMQQQKAAVMVAAGDIDVNPVEKVVAQVSASLNLVAGMTVEELIKRGPEAFAKMETEALVAIITKHVPGGAAMLATAVKDVKTAEAASLEAKAEFAQDITPPDAGGRKGPSAPGRFSRLVE